MCSKVTVKQNGKNVCDDLKVLRMKCPVCFCCFLMKYPFSWEMIIINFKIIFAVLNISDKAIKRHRCLLHVFVTGVIQYIQ